MFQIELKHQFIQHLVKKYSLRVEILEPLIADQLLSPLILELPKKYLQEIEDSVAAFYELRMNSAYQQNILDRTPELENHRAQNFSVCNSLDFHLTPDDQQLKLVEVNTNASFLALGLEMFESRQVPHFSGNTENLIASMFEDELSLLKKQQIQASIAIIDDQPSKQKMYAEFLVYQEYLRKHGYRVNIYDRGDVSALQSDLVYNRSTDFFLTEDASRGLKSAYLKNQIGFSPNPWEYALLADKTRFIEWTTPGHLDQFINLSNNAKNQILKVLPHTYTVTDKNKDEVWAERKKLFFKPKRSFGAKQTLKGTALRHNAFEEIYNSDFIAQELISPSEVEFKVGPSTHRMKYDLRCYFYQNRLQSIIARVYQGQVTNLRTPNGGFACVVFN